MRPVALLLLLASCSHALSGRASVVDGDTLDVEGERVRLFGIDAPEHDQRCGALACGREARRALAELLGDREVRCERVAEDRFGRTVATCAIGGADVGASMVRAGWALEFRRYSRGRYRAEEEEARRERRGVWAGSFEWPWRWRRDRKAGGAR